MVLVLAVAVSPYGSDAGGHGTASLDIAANGAVRFEGRWMRASDLEDALKSRRVRIADIAIESDASVRVVSNVQRIMVDQDVRVARVHLAGSLWGGRARR